MSLPHWPLCWCKPDCCCFFFFFFFCWLFCFLTECSCRTHFQLQRRRIVLRVPCQSIISNLFAHLFIYHRFIIYHLPSLSHTFLRFSATIRAAAFDQIRNWFSFFSLFLSFFTSSLPLTLLIWPMAYWATSFACLFDLYSTAFSSAVLGCCSLDSN